MTLPPVDMFIKDLVKKKGLEQNYFCPNPLLCNHDDYRVEACAKRQLPAV